MDKNSVMIHIRLPKDVKKALASRAVFEECSVRALVELAIRKYLEMYKDK